MDFRKGVEGGPTRAVEFRYLVLSLGRGAVMAEIAAVKQQLECRKGAVQGEDAKKLPECKQNWSRPLEIR